MLDFLWLRREFRFPCTHCRFGFLIIVVGLLGRVHGVVHVQCKSKAPESDIPSRNSCFLYEFPMSPYHNEVYNISVDNTKTDANRITLVKFVSSPVVKHFPSVLFSTFPNLEIVRMSNTGLEELGADTFVNAMRLSELDLSVNKVKVIRNVVFSHVARLAQAIAQSVENTNATMDHDFPLPLYELSILYLNQNEIVEIEDNSFYDLRNLGTIYLERNRLKRISRRTFAGLPELAHLDLYTNEIETIEDGAFDLPKLRALYLAQNKLKSLSNSIFDRLPNINVLSLKENNLRHIGRSLYRLSSVEFIALDNNPIEDIDLVAFAHLPNLNSLTLERSGFKFGSIKIDPHRKWNSTLRLLNLSNNNLVNATDLLYLKIFPHMDTLALNKNPYKNFSIGNYHTTSITTPKPNVNNTVTSEHSVVHNLVQLTLSKPFFGPIFKMIVYLQPRPPTMFRKMFPKLIRLQLNGTRVDCASMLRFAEQLEADHVRVEHDC